MALSALEIKLSLLAVKTIKLSVVALATVLSAKDPSSTLPKLPILLLEHAILLLKMLAYVAISLHQMSGKYVLRIRLAVEEELLESIL